MTGQPPLSITARRTGDSPISYLMARALGTADLISLAAGFVDQATLPIEAVAAVVESLRRDAAEGRRSLQYGTTQGDPSLRQRLLRQLERSEAVAPGTFDHLLDRLIVTSGSQQFLYLVVEALIDPGDIVLVESPTYFVFLSLLQAHGATVIGIDTDSGGLRVDALDRVLADLDAQGRLDRVKLIYTVSEHCNPSGLSLSAERRGALVATARKWSRSHPIYVLEDSAYRGLTFEGTEPPSVWSHDRDGQTVILARTFSKTFSPGLKTGYGVLPAELVVPITSMKGNHDFGSSHFTQQVIERVLADELYEPQIRLLAATYRRKCDVLLTALDEHLGPLGLDVLWTRPHGGLFVWLTVPEGIDTGRDGEFFGRCLKEGVLYVPGAYSFAREPGPVPSNCARLTFGVTDEPGLTEGVRRLARALAQCRPSAPKRKREQSSSLAGGR